MQWIVLYTSVHNCYLHCNEFTHCLLSFSSSLPLGLVLCVVVVVFYSVALCTKLTWLVAVLASECTSTYTQHISFHNNCVYTVVLAVYGEHFSHPLNYGHSTKAQKEYLNKFQLIEKSHSPVPLC